MTPILILLGKILGKFSRIFNFGSGGTWPGELALFFQPDIFSRFASYLQSGMILIAGTNGKTTTARMVLKILEETTPTSPKLKIIHNETGANLLNGLVSAFIQQMPITGAANLDWAILEVDEASLPIVVAQLRSFNKKLIIVLLDLFRDQLDRYGEVDIIASKWEKTLSDLPKKTTIILNADDPQIAFLSKKTRAQVLYFGIDKKNKFLPHVEHATDSTYCRFCGNKLSYQGIYFSHLGIWFCRHCDNKRPVVDISGWTSPLPGLYNEYNTLAAVGVGKTLGLTDAVIKQTLSKFTPAFGRQEEFHIDGKKIRIFLSKNPAGFNASLRTVLELMPKVMLLALNDRIPDGRDVSWIWDVDFEMIPDDIEIIVSGDRVYDMALRIKYAKKFQIAQRAPDSKFQIKSKFQNSKLLIEPELKKAIETGLKFIKEEETLYILPTYSAMLEVRKILTGRRIL